MPLKARSIDSELESLPKAKAAFIEPMLLLPAGALPEAAEWLYELDGYRALAINSEDAHLRHSRFMALREEKKPKDVRPES